MDERVALLTEKQRECLRLVWRHRESKEIARALGISSHSVDGRIKTAMRTLGAQDRYEAARLLAQAEAGAEAARNDQPLVYGSPDVPPVPRPEPQEDPLNVDERLAEPMILGEAQAVYRLMPAPEARGFGLPFPTQARRRNDLGVGARLIWVLAVAIGTAIAFGALAAGLEALSRLA